MYILSIQRQCPYIQRNSAVHVNCTVGSNSRLDPALIQGSTQLFSTQIFV